MMESFCLLGPRKPLRAISALACCLLALMLSGCEEIGLTPKPEPPPQVSETSAEPQPPMPSAEMAPMTPPPVTPPVQTPEQFVAELMQKPSEQITEADLIRLAESTPANQQVKALSLKGAAVTRNGLAQIGRLPELRKLILAGTPVLPADWSALSTAVQLEELDAEATGLDDTTIAALSFLVNLKSLNISRTSVTDAGFQALVGMRKLESIVCSGLRISGAGFEAFTSKYANSPLKHINVSNTNFGSNGFEHIDGMKSLESFAAGTSDSSDQKIQGLKNFRKLKELLLQGNQISDQGLKFLTSLDDLEHLDIGDANFVSDFTLEKISKQKALKRVRVENTSCTLAGVQAFKKARPDCVVLFMNTEY